MRSRYRSRVLDRTPVLLGARGDLAHVGNQAVRVAAVDAVHFLDAIQLRQLMAIDDEVPAASDTCDAVDREADPLIDGDPRIEDKEHGQY
jgi:hypothetical protein